VARSDDPDLKVAHARPAEIRQPVFTHSPHDLTQKGKVYAARNRHRRRSVGEMRGIYPKRFVRNAPLVAFPVQFVLAFPRTDYRAVIAG